MHNLSMRTTVTLDEDAYELASLYAKGKGIRLGKALSEMVRALQTAPPQESLPAGLKRLPNGLLVFAGRGTPLTDEMVKAALEEED